MKYRYRSGKKITRRSHARKQIEIYELAIAWMEKRLKEGRGNPDLFPVIIEKMTKKMRRLSPKG